MQLIFEGARNIKYLVIILPALLLLSLSTSSVSQENPQGSISLSMSSGGGSSVSVHIGQGGVVGIGVCVSSQCGPMNSGYNGPLGSTSSPEMEKAREQAYRNSVQQSYQQAVENLNASAQKYLQEKRQALNWSPEEFEVERESFLNGLNQSIPDLSTSVPQTPEMRRKVNPFPTGISQQILDKTVDPVWSAIRSTDLTRVADEVDELLSANRPVDGISEEYYKAQKQQYDFLRKELQVSQIIDNQGLLNVPFVDKTGLRLKTNEYSLEGQKVRSIYNDHLAVNSTVNAFCRNEGADKSLCTQVIDYQEMLNYGLHLLDAIAASETWNDPVVQRLYHDLKVKIAFGKGIVAAGGDFVSGIAQMVAHPIDTVAAIGHAIANYDKTWNAMMDGVKSTWSEFENGDDLVRAELGGRVAFEVLTSFIPAAKAGTISKMISKSSTLTSLSKGLARPIQALHHAGNVTKNQAAVFLRNKLGRQWVSSLSTGYYQVNQKVHKFFNLEGPVNNPLPKDGWYAHMTKKNYAEDFKNGVFNQLNEDSDFMLWVTAADDLSGLKGQQIIERLALFEDREAKILRSLQNDDVLIKFKMKNPDNSVFNSPIQFPGENGIPGRLNGWVPFGRTMGGAREWLLNSNAPAKGFVDMDSIQIIPLGK